MGIQLKYCIMILSVKHVNNDVSVLLRIVIWMAIRVDLFKFIYFNSGKAVYLCDIFMFWKWSFERRLFNYYYWQGLMDVHIHIKCFREYRKWIRGNWQFTDHQSCQNHLTMEISSGDSLKGLKVGSVNYTSWWRTNFLT